MGSITGERFRQINVDRNKVFVRRKVDQGGIKIDNEAVSDWQLKLDKSFSGKIIKAGKREFRKMKIV